jgi:DNA-directed RNA polymerase specialized sigma24 family protein
MSRRRYRLPPLVGAQYVAGEVYEFRPEHDLVKRPPGPPVELTPVGPPATVYEFGPEHDLVNQLTPDALLARKHRERVREVRAAIDKLELSDLERAILAGYYEGALTLKEVAKQTAVSQAAIYRIHQRLLVKLRRALAPFYPGLWE